MITCHTYREHFPPFRSLTSHSYTSLHLQLPANLAGTCAFPESKQKNPTHLIICPLTNMAGFRLARELFALSPIGRVDGLHRYAGCPRPLNEEMGGKNRA